MRWRQGGCIASETQDAQVVHCLFGPPGRQCPLAHQTPQDLDKLQIEQMDGVQCLAARVNAVRDPLSCWGLQHPINRGRCIDDDHRLSRSSRTRRAVSRSTGMGLRFCRRSRNSAIVGAGPNLLQLPKQVVGDDIPMVAARAFRPR